MNIKNLISNYRPIVICGCVLGLIFGALRISSILSWGSSGPKRAYYTTDGVTTFVDKLDLIPPFDHGGKPAYRMHMYSYKGKQIPLCMDRYTPEAKTLLEKARGDNAAMANLALMALGAKDVHAPGSVDGPWVSLHSPEGVHITMVPQDDPTSHEVFP